MKIALCISGMPRSFKSTFASVKRCILEPYQPDVFISTWDSVRIDETWPETDSVEEMLDLYQPVKFDVERFDERRKRSFETNRFHRRADQAGRVVARTIPMYYKVYLANLHKHMHEQENSLKYDVVVRCRSDLLFSEPVTFYDRESSRVYFASENSSNGVNDQFWYSDSNTSNQIASLYLNIPILWHAGALLHGESLLRTFIENTALNAEFVSVPYVIQRSALPGSADDSADVPPHAPIHA